MMVDVMVTVELLELESGTLSVRRCARDFPICDKMREGCVRIYVIRGV